MPEHKIHRDAIQVDSGANEKSQARPPHPDDRRKEHDADALLLLDRFMRIPQDAPLSEWPSTAELQAERIFGLRPVNRIGDLKKGKFNRHCYDFEMISCGHGVNRWRLHWPNRPGHPKPKNQTVLPLDTDSPESSFGRSQTHKAHRSAGSWKAQPIVPVKSWEQVAAEREEKMRQPEPSFELVP